MIRLLKTAVARIQDAQAAMPSDLDGMACDLGDLDELLGVLSSYTRRLSSAVEGLPDLTEDLRVNEQDGPVPGPGRLQSDRHPHAGRGSGNRPSADRGQCGSSTQRSAPNARPLTVGVSRGWRAGQTVRGFAARCS